MTAAETSAEIRARIDSLADEVVTRHFERRPDLAKRYGEVGRIRCREDARFHLSYLAAALEVDTGAIFVDYVAWAKTVLVSRNVSALDLAESLAVLGDVLVASMTPALAAPAMRMIDAACAQLPEMPVTVPSFIDPASASGALGKRYLETLLTMDSHAASRVIADALNEGFDFRTIGVDVLEPVQHEVGRLWQLNQISVAVEHFCSSVTQQLLAQTATLRRANPEPKRKRVIAMCAPGELHEIGLRAITEVLSLDGWETLYLGANTPAMAAVQLCSDRKADVLLVSATLPPHIAGVAQVVRLLRAEPRLSGTRVYVGGRAFSRHPDLWRFTGADGWQPTATAVADALSAI
jgi:methanogenic corrinoid protein MtbC1